MAGCDTLKPAFSSVTFISPRDSRSKTARRVGSAKALKTSASTMPSNISRYLFVSNPDIAEIRFQRRRAVRSHDRTNISIRPHQNPVAWLHAIVIAYVLAVIDDVTSRPHGVDVKILAWRDSRQSLDVITEQRPVRPLVEVEQARREASRAPDRRVRRPITRQNAALALGFFQCQR